MWKNIPGGRLSLSELLGIHSLETFKLSVTPANVQCRILTFTCLLEDKLETESPVGTNHSMSRKASLKIISPCSLFQRHAAARFSSEAASGWKAGCVRKPCPCTQQHTSAWRLLALRPGVSVCLAAWGFCRFELRCPCSLQWTSTAWADAVE